MLHPWAGPRPLYLRPKGPAHRNHSAQFGTGNPVAMKVNAVITDILKVSMYGIVGSLGTKDGLNYHRRILDAIKARDGPRAESLMEEHVERTILRLISKRGGDRKSRAGRKVDGKA